MDPAISVIMAVHNGECYLKAAVDSIRKQSFNDFEFIIVDDGSTDGTGSILAQLSVEDSRIRVLHRPHSGLSNSLNMALHESVGKLIARMDADDISLGERFARQFEYLSEHPDVCACGTWAVRIDPDEWLLDLWENAICHTEIVRAILTGSSTPIIHPTVMIRKEALMAIGGYRDDLLYAQDFGLWCDLSKVGRLANIPIPLLKYRLRTDSVTALKRAAQVSTIRRLRNELQQHYEYFAPEVYVSNPEEGAYFRIFRHALRGGRFPASVKWWGMALANGEFRLLKPFTIYRVLRRYWARSPVWGIP